MGDRARANWAEKCGGGASVPLSVGGAGSPSNTMSPGPSLPPYQVASWSIQPFGYNTDRQDRQRSDRVGRTVTCNGHLKIVQSSLLLEILSSVSELCNSFRAVYAIALCLYSSQVGVYQNGYTYHRAVNVVRPREDSSCLMPKTWMKFEITLFRATATGSRVS